MRLVQWTLAVALALTASAQNILVNGDFESNPPSNLGNNIGWSIAPWVLGTGNQPNVVKVDGPGGYDYGINGPESDASAPGAGKPQHYLDIANGSNDFYQSFTPQCEGVVEFGGAFSTRGNQGGTGSLTLRKGTGTSGVIVGNSNVVTLPAGNSKTDPWKQVSFSAPVLANQTYSLVVRMDNNVNFDNAFARYKLACNPPPPTDPCCPPWNVALFKSMMVYQGTGNITDPYTLKFVPTPLFIQQMQAYIDYLHLLNPAITKITVHFRLDDAGTGPTPVTGGQVGNNTFWLTWTEGLSAPSPVPNWFPPGQMQVNHWYTLHTGIYLEGGQKFFPDKCGSNLDFYVRLQVLSAAKKAAPMLEIRTREGAVTTMPIPNQ